MACASGKTHAGRHPPPVSEMIRLVVETRRFDANSTQVKRGAARPRLVFGAADLALGGAGSRLAGLEHPRLTERFANHALGLAFRHEALQGGGFGDMLGDLRQQPAPVLQLIAEGLSNKEMAERLFVSENTVKTHASRVFDKLGASRRTQAVQMAKSQGILA